LLGRTINGFGDFVDGGGVPKDAIYEKVSLEAKAPDAMSRERIVHPLPTGVKAIDTLLTLGEGQRIGIFSGSGVGKSTLLGMIARSAKVDVNVIVLVGERGREVREFIEHDLGAEGVARSVIIVSTSDDPALMTIKASNLGMSIAEKFRDQGKKVLLMMDSLARFAMARRTIDNASGLPTLGGKTISMEPSMQRFLERAGTSDKGSITGIYTVLVEGDDLQAPIPDMARGILDGHIVLDRNLAAIDQFPAINVLASASRVMDKVVGEEHWKLARETKKYMGIYRDNEDSFKLGTYIPRLDKEVDMAKIVMPKIMNYLKQEREESFEFEESLKSLEGVMR
jgi:flagellum-specific ATP synthase